VEAYILKKFPCPLGLIAAISLFVSISGHAEDILNGKTLHHAKCVQCHAEKSGFGNADMIYLRTDRKVKDLAKLKNMVSMCNTELRLDLFPEDEADLVAHLNQDFYKITPHK
jgi:hypothetical protein